jgi:hypothetical protein
MMILAKRMISVVEWKSPFLGEEGHFVRGLDLLLTASGQGVPRDRLAHSSPCD